MPKATGFFYGKFEYIKGVSYICERTFINICHMSETIVKLGYLADATRFRRISEKLYVDGDKIYKEAGIDFKASWFSVYYVLVLAESPLTVMQIAEQIEFSHITVKNVLRELESAELIHIVPNPTDKRSKLISLSSKGRYLLRQLKPTWLAFAAALKRTFQSGHPDFMNILNRIDKELAKNPINKIVAGNQADPVTILDYKPSLKQFFYELAGPWLSEVVNGNLEEEDLETLHNPDEAYIKKGGFLFYALYKDHIVGCVALKRMDEDTFELAKLYMNPTYRNLGIATKLIERCISRCNENHASELWIQSTMSMQEAHKLYYKLGFMDKEAPPQMQVLARTEKIMYMKLS
jgi:DNA-binding MarR family transcriptional regulator/N-acetylglutamate synthase-like GNAT family acetyltransferase